MSAYLSTFEAALSIAQGTRNASEEPFGEALQHGTASEISMDDFLTYMAEPLVGNGRESEAGLGVYAAFDEDSDEENEEGSSEGEEGTGADVARTRGSIIGVSISDAMRSHLRSTFVPIWPLPGFQPVQPGGRPLSPTSIVQQHHQARLPVGELAPHPTALHVLMFFQPSPDLPVTSGTVNPQVLHAPADLQAHRAVFQFPLGRNARPVAHENGGDGVWGNEEAVGRALANYAIPASPFGTVPRIGETPPTPTPAVTMVVELQPAANLHRAHIVGVRIVRPHYRYSPNAKDPRLGYTVEIADGTTITRAYDFMDRTFFNAEELIEAYWNRRSSNDQAMIGHMRSHLYRICAMDIIFTRGHRAMIAKLPELEYAGLHLIMQHDLHEIYYAGLDIEGARIICYYDGVVAE